MVIDDLDIRSIAILPGKADAPLVVDPDAPMAGAVAGELLKPVARWNTKKIKSGGAVKLF